MNTLRIEIVIVNTETVIFNVQRVGVSEYTRAMFSKMLITISSSVNTNELKKKKT